MFPEEIRTDRLRLRRLCRETVPALELHRHVRAGAPGMTEVGKSATWDPHESPRDTREYLREVERLWDDRERATYAIYGDEGATDRESDPELAGTTNLDLDPDREAADLGIWLRRAFRGRGYAGERAGALLALAFDDLGLDAVRAAHRDGNDRSRRAIRKYVDAFGGEYDGVLRDFVETDDGARDLHRYVVTREQYREAVGRSEESPVPVGERGGRE